MNLGKVATVSKTCYNARSILRVEVSCRYFLIGILRSIALYESLVLKESLNQMKPIISVQRNVEIL